MLFLLQKITKRSYTDQVFVTERHKLLQNRSGTENFMNIQIFGTGKCFDTKKAIRYFKERGVSFQFIDLKEKGLSRGELRSVSQAVGGLEELLDAGTKARDALALISYLSDEDKEEKILENQAVLKTPIVRNGRKASVGYQPEVWKQWSLETRS